MENEITTKWLEGNKQAKIFIGDVSSCLCTFYNNGKANIMVIDSVWTDEKYRNQGYGTKLMCAAINLAKEQNTDSVELVVNKDNFSAKKLYEKIGMEITNKDYYRLILNKWTT